MVLWSFSCEIPGVYPIVQMIWAGIWCWWTTKVWMSTPYWEDPSLFFLL